MKVLLLFTNLFFMTVANPLLNTLLPEDDSSEEVTTEYPSNTTNSSAQNLYVIRAVVYEIGILTNVDDNDTSISNDTLTNEQIDLTFFNPDKNGSIIDLGNIPLPVQTNISGQIFTGIAPVDAGSISKPNFNSINISGNILPGTSIGDTLENLLPSLPIFNGSDGLISNLDTHTISDEFPNLSTSINIKNVTSENMTIFPLSHLGSLFEPLSSSSSNHTLFTAKKT